MIRRTMAALLAVSCMLVASLAFAPPAAEAQTAPQGPGLVVLESTESFEDTWSALIDALDANGNIRTIATVDHAAAAASAGLELDGSRVVFFGNPALGTPIMQASRTAGIDLPQKMHVFEQDGAVFVSYNDVSYLASRHGAGEAATLNTISGALNGLARAATNTQGAPATPLQNAPGEGTGLVTTTSGSDFETTWSQLISAINGSPANVAFTVDHGANSGGALPPTRLVVFGNPAIGTPIMDSSASAGIDLPLKMLVFEDGNGVTHVVSTAPSFVQSRHGVGNVATIANATGAIANFTNAATAGSGDQVQGVTELAFTGSEPIALAGAALMLTVGGLFVVSSRRFRD